MIWFVPASHGIVSVVGRHLLPSVCVARLEVPAVMGSSPLPVTLFLGSL